MDKKVKGTSDIEAIQKYITQFEKENQVKFIFVLETGSRAYDLATKHSDYDVKGVFYEINTPYKLLEKEEFMDGDVLSKSKKQRFKQTGIKVRNIETEVDIDFFEVGYYFSQLKGQEESLLYWIGSEQIYINNFDQFSQRIQHSMNLPRNEILERISKDYEKVKNKQKREAKKNINMIIDSMRLLYIQIFNKSSPYKISELIEELEEKFYNELSESPISGIITSIQSEIQELYYMKKNGKGLQLILPKDEWIQLVQYVCEQEKKVKPIDIALKPLNQIKDDLFQLYNDIVQSINT